MKVKEVRKLNPILVKQYLIRRGLCTFYSEKEFDYFLEECENCENVTTDKLYNLAFSIYEESDALVFPDFPEFEIISGIMHDLVRECSITYFERFAY